MMKSIFDQDEYAKNIYVIRHKLSELRPVNGRTDRWEYPVGNFNVVMYCYDIQESPPSELDNILKYRYLDVILQEYPKEGSPKNISLRDDLRFKNYEPIQYNIIESPSGRLNLSNGDKMPIPYICELIRYLHRLSNLTAFM